MQPLQYPDDVIPILRFQYCPICATPLVREIIFDDNIPRVRCPSCDWIQLSSNVTGVNIIVKSEEGIVAIYPPNREGVGFPGGLVEYGEDPETAAIREVYEETGLEVVVVDCLGWYFLNRTTWPGPVIQFMYEAKVIGGTLRGSSEGEVKIIPEDNFPEIPAHHPVSQKTMEVYRAKRTSTPSGMM
jgi:8-oxo-dGTP pyrophosphatase MutT (NUDIX family)